MKRSTILTEIRLCGYNGDTQRAALLAAKHGIGNVASRKAYLAGQKLKELGEPKPEVVRVK